MNLRNPGLLVLVLVLVCVIIGLPACAPGSPEAPPGNGVIAERLDRIDHAIQDAIDDGEIPGAVALIARDGQVVYHKAFGFANIEAGTPMQKDTIFRIASMTKAVTSVGVMLLYEKGLFGLNDPVSRYLPEFSDMRVITEVAEDGSVTATRPAEKPILIIDLLTHSSGIGYPFIGGTHQFSYVNAGVIDGLTATDKLLADQIKILAAQALIHEPGTHFTYGLSVDVLGRLIEVVSGQALDQFFAENITQALKMPDTYFYLPQEKSDRLATLYAFVEDKGLVVSDGTESNIKLDNPNYPIVGAKSYFSGGAGLSSTAHDYARFIQMLSNGGELDGVRILGRKSVELMRTARIDWDDDGTADFGLGFSVLNDLGQYGELGSEGTYSWGGAFYTSFFIDPKERVVAVLMSQLRPASSTLDKRFQTLVYQSLE